MESPGRFDWGLVVTGGNECPYKKLVHSVAPSDLQRKRVIRADRCTRLDRCVVDARVPWCNRFIVLEAKVSVSLIIIIIII